MGQVKLVLRTEWVRSNLSGSGQTCPPSRMGKYVHLSSWQNGSSQICPPGRMGQVKPVWVGSNLSSWGMGQVKNCSPGRMGRVKSVPWENGSGQTCLSRVKPVLLGNGSGQNLAKINTNHFFCSMSENVDFIPEMTRLLCHCLQLFSLTNKYIHITIIK